MRQLLFLALIVPLALAQSAPWTGIISSGRAIDWSAVGVPGGIPTNRSQCVNTQCATVTTAGASATAAQINAALANAPANTYVLLTAGTFSVGAHSINLTANNVTLRGNGADSTFIVFGNNSSCGLGSISGSVCVFDSLGLYNGSAAVLPPSGTHQMAWTAGFAAGSTSLTGNICGSGCVPPVVGQTIIVDQGDDASDNGGIFICGLSSCNNEGVTYTAEGRFISSVYHSQQELLLVCSISGSGTGPYTIGITHNGNCSSPTGLYAANWNKPGSNPGIWWPGTITGAAIENLSIDCSANSGGAGGFCVTFYDSFGGWESGVRSIKPNGQAHTIFYQSAHNTSTHNYHYGSPGATQSYGSEFFEACDNLVQNNIYQQVASPSAPGNGCGNVFAYSFSIYNLFSNNNWMQVTYSGHNAAQYFNLYEGNILNGLDNDNDWGTAPLGATYFRNRIWGTETVSGLQRTLNIAAHQIYWGARGFNIIGNVLGTTGINTTYQVTATGAAACDSTVYRLGYRNTECAAGPTDSLVASTLMRWGNCDSATGFTACKFDNTESSPAGAGSGITQIPANTTPASQTLPASFYLSAKPTWFGSVPWPPIGPDVTGGNITGVNGLAYKTPAMNCYFTTMGGSADGTGSVLTFNANTCYGSSPSSPDLTITCGNVPTCSSSIPDTFDPAMAYSNAPANLTAIDTNRGVYGYQPDTFKLKNTSGTFTITINSVSVPTGYSADNNCYTGSTPHGLPVTLTTGSSCTIGVAYTPTDIAPASGNIIINFTENSASFSNPIAVQNTAGTTAELTITNASVPSGVPSFYTATDGLWWAFPVVLPLSSQSTTFTLENEGSTTTATSIGVAIYEGNIAEKITATNFSLSANTCGTGAGSLTPGTDCTITVTYSPLAVGAHRALLQITSTNGGVTSLLQSEIYGEAVSSLLSRTEGNPYCPATGVPVYPGNVTTDGPATLPQLCVNTTDAQINYGGNTISGVTTYNVCPSGCTYTSLNSAMLAIQTLSNSSPASACGFWIKIHAQTPDNSGTQAVYTEHLADTSWPTVFNPIANGGTAPNTCTSWNFITTDRLSDLPPPGNRISPAWEGYSMVPGFPPYSWPTGGPGAFVPIIEGDSINTETIRIPQAVGMKVRLVGVHFSGEPQSGTIAEGNTPIVTAAYFNSSSVNFPDCIGSPPASGICTPSSNIIFDRVLVSGTPNWVSICAFCVHGAGIGLSGTTLTTVENSYIADIHCNSVGACSTDAKALSPGGSGFVVNSGNKVYNNFLSAAGIPMIAGGGRTTATPTDLMFINNTIFKPWFFFRNNTYGQLGQPPAIFMTPAFPEQAPIKNSMEFKNYNRVLVENLIIFHCTNTGQADQFGECLHLNNLNNPNDGQICGGATNCQGFIPPATTYALPAATPSSSFAGVTVSNITVRNFILMNLNKCFLYGNEYNQSNTSQLTPPVGSMGPFSVHDGLCDDMDGVKYGPKGGGAWNRLLGVTVSPPLVPASTMGSFCPSGTPCTWTSWPGYITNNFNDKGRVAATNPFFHTMQRVTAISNTMNLANPPVAQTSGALGGVGGSDRSASAVIYDASASQSGGVCNVTVHYVSSQIPNIVITSTKNVVFDDTPDIGLVAAAGKYWSTLPNVTVDTLITGPPAGFTGHFTGTCPFVTSFSQAGLVYTGSPGVGNTLPPLPFLGFVVADNGPSVLYTGMQFLDSIFLGDYQGPATGSPSYDVNWDGTSTTNGYCWTGNMMVSKSGPNTLSLTAPTNYPGCTPNGISVHHNSIVNSGGGGSQTFGDSAIGFAHYVDGSYTKLMFGGTNDYTVSGTAATYSTTNGPIGVSPSNLATSLIGVLDGVTGGNAPITIPIAPIPVIFADTEPLPTSEGRNK